MLWFCRWVPGLLVLGLVVSLESGNSSADGDFLPRIVGGFTVPETVKVPHMASIWLTETRQFICGGSIIGHIFILTAAHCFNNLRGPNSVYVDVGSKTLYPGGEKYSVSTIFVHEEYKIATSKHDIAIVRTMGSMLFTPPTNTGAIKLSVYRIPPQTLYLYGWGLTSVRTLIRSSSLIFILSVILF